MSIDWYYNQFVMPLKAIFVILSARKFMILLQLVSVIVFPIFQIVSAVNNYTYPAQQLYIFIKLKCFAPKYNMLVFKV